MDFTITIQASGDHRGPDDTLLSPAAIIGEEATAAAREVAEADPAIAAAREAVDALVAAGLQVESAVFSSGNLRGGSFDLLRDLPDVTDVATAAEAQSDEPAVDSPTEG